MAKLYGDNLKKGDIFAVGLDVIKDPHVITDAYYKLGDPNTYNSLARWNRELEANVNL